MTVVFAPAIQSTIGYTAVEMKERFLLLAVIWIISPTVCLSCGAPGLDYDLEVSMEPAIPVIGGMVELHCRVSESSLDQWASSVVSSGSRLSWSEGGVTDWSTYAERELSYNSATGEVVLRISNFGLRDYGVYECHCRNDFTYLQYEVCGEHDGLPTHCSATIELQILPSAQLTKISRFPVDSPGAIVPLPICSGGWFRIGNSGLLDANTSTEITVNSPEDQAKFICTPSTTMQEIVYVTITAAGYHPLRILYPNSATADLQLSVASTQIPACATLTSLPGETTTSLYVTFNDTVTKLEANVKDAVIAVDTQQCSWVTAYFVDEFLNKVMDFDSSLFSCVVTSPWESLTRNFTISKVRSKQTQSCPLPVLSPGSSVSPSPSTMIISPPPTMSLPSPAVQTATPLPPSIEAPPPLHPSTMSLPSPAVQIATGTPLPPSTEDNDIISPPPLHPSTMSLPSPAVQIATGTPLPPSTEDNGGKEISSVAIIAGAAVVAGVVVFTVVIVICVLEIVRRRHKRTKPRKMYQLPENNDYFEPSSGFPFPPQPSLIDTHVNTLQPLTLSSTQQFTHNGVPVSKQMAKCISGLQLTPWLFPYEKLEFQEELGSGAFGVVKKALAHSLTPGEPATVVAVKMLKDDASSDDHEEKDLISELKVLKHVGAHPNIVCLLGASVNNGLLYVIVEYCSSGNLLNYLRSKRNDQSSPLTARHCVDMATQVATGMEFLWSKGCIHRDLAARNVLITDDFVMKVADFGLARKIYESVYRPTGGKVPVKWLAPESIIDHMYTVQSDVWSFGIVLWEILTLGRTPYPGKSAETMIRDLEDGYRMPRPPSCPVQIYDVMMKCWQWSSDNRPTFSELVKLLEEILTSDEPALNRHYYNMDVSGVQSEDPADLSNDSTLCSCENLDTSTGQLHICHSCGNTFTTTRSLDSDPDKVFCDDCAQMPEYMSRSSLDLLSMYDDLGTVSRRARRWSQRIHSNDSGVKVSSEGTSEDYQVTVGPRAAAFARQLTESLQSMCSECKAELEPGLGFLWGEGSSTSLSSVCTACRGHLEGHAYANTSSPLDEMSREREEYMRKRMDKLLASQDHPRQMSTEETVLLHRERSEEEEEEREGGEGREEEEMVNGVVDVRDVEGEEMGFSEDTEKVELRPKYSNDSVSESLYLKRTSAPPLMTTANGGVDSMCFSPPAHFFPSGTSTPSGRLSAHPRNRDKFEELGFEETDL